MNLARYRSKLTNPVLCKCKSSFSFAALHVHCKCFPDGYSSFRVHFLSVLLLLVMAVISTTPPSMPYLVWVFVLGPSSGPHRMLVRREPDGYVGIKADEKVFTPDALIKVTVITIDQKIYRVYFEEKVHNANHTKAKYVFMRLHNSDYAINVSVEDDLPIFLDCLTKSVFLMLCNLIC